MDIRLKTLLCRIQAPGDRILAEGGNQVKPDFRMSGEIDKGARSDLRHRKIRQYTCYWS